MVGTPAVAAFIGFWLFWILLLYGWASSELGRQHVIVFLLLWMLGRIGLAYLSWAPAQALISPYIAVLDIALAFVIFKGDVRLT
jgi:hypothetical protein